MGMSIMQMDQVALSAIKDVGYMAVAKTGQNNRVALSELAKQSDMDDINEKIPSEASSLNKLALDADISKISGCIAPDYSSLTFPIAEGTLCMYARRLYICSVPGGIPTSEEWDSTHWTQIRVSEFKPLFGALADGGALTDGVSVEVPNNKLSTLSTSQATLTLNVTPTSGTVPNFAVEITASVDCTVTVTSTVGGTPTTLKYAAAAGNELEASKTYQLTCVGSCWTLAEFTQPTP